MHKLAALGFEMNFLKWKIFIIILVNGVYTTNRYAMHWLVHELTFFDWNWKFFAWKEPLRLPTFWNSHASGNSKLFRFVWKVKTIDQQQWHMSVLYNGTHTQSCLLFLTEFGTAKAFNIENVFNDKFSSIWSFFSRLSSGNWIVKVLADCFTTDTNGIFNALFERK